MEYQAKSVNPITARSQCLVIGIFQSRALSGVAADVDAAAGGIISRVIKSGDFSGKSGEHLLIHDCNGIAAQRLMLVGAGTRKSFDLPEVTRMVTLVTRQLQKGGSTDANFCLGDLLQDAQSTYRLFREAVSAAEAARYRFTACKSKAEPVRKPLRRLTLITTNIRQTRKASLALAHGQAIGAGSSLTRELGDLPGNICTPTYLANQARSLAKKYRKLNVDILSEADMKQLGMGALLSVSRGSRQPAKLIVMKYNGGKAKEKPVVLVGKGLTFDAGGISIKPAQGMEEMKYDMCGGATVFGVMQMALELRLPMNLVGLVPASENLPDGDANKPGDIVTSMSGQTIEVLNTDAEGRLILCDALTYAERFNPAAVIDMATLTGACIIALGRNPSAVLGNNDKLIADLIAAGEKSGDRLWQLPLWDEYQKQLDSNFADMANIGGRDGGTITAACFLSRYAKKYHWAHLDIAGTAWNVGANKGASGRPVPMLSQFLLRRCKLDA